MIRRSAALLAAAALALPGIAHAQEAMADAADSGDTAWILTSSALVLMMTMPGLILFYGGLLRQKSVLSVMIQCGAIAAMGSLLWIVCGYTMAFGTVTNGWLGGGNACLLYTSPSPRDGLLSRMPSSA